MSKLHKFSSLEPRILRYRTHYRVYVMMLMILSLMILGFWGIKIHQTSMQAAYTQYPFEFGFSAFYLFGFTLCYFAWARSRFNMAIQVYSDHLLLHKGKEKTRIPYADLESINVVCWSLFYLKMKNGHKYYFNSSLERVDYIWEGLHQARPDLFTPSEFEKFRVNLVQYDHHQKRKEWFFRHKMVDVFNWVILPACFIFTAFVIQAQDVVIHQLGLYFFRLFMYSLLVLLITSFFFSMILKRLIFDQQVEEQMQSDSTDKLRRMEFEGVILQRSKVFQFVTVCFAFALIIKSDINFYSLTKTKKEIGYFKIPAGKTLVVDNRFNCFDCRYQLADGDIIVFGKGIIGQVMAKEGEFVGEIGQDLSGRLMASEQVREVPKGHLAVKAPNGKDILMVKIDDLIGKIQK